MINEGRQSDPKYAEWKLACWTRDEGICQICGEPGEEVHHIASYAKAPQKRYLESNGITLCRGCHAQTDSYYNPQNRGLNNTYGKGADKKKTAVAFNIREWIKPHLNSIFIFVLTLFIIACIAAIIIRNIDENSAKQASTAAILYYTGLLIFIIASIWILHQKSRHLANILLILTPVIGWAIFLYAILENGQTESQDKNNWFRRHLNLTFLFVYLESIILYIVFRLLGIISDNL